MLCLVVSLALGGQAPSPPTPGIAHTAARQRARAQAKASAKSARARAVAQQRQAMLAREAALAPLRAQAAREQAAWSLELRRVQAAELQAAAAADSALSLRREVLDRDRRDGRYVGPTSGLVHPAYRPRGFVVGR